MVDIWTKMRAANRFGLLSHHRELCSECNPKAPGPPGRHAAWCPEAEKQETDDGKRRLKSKFTDIIGQLLDGEFTIEDVQDCVDEAFVRRIMES